MTGAAPARARYRSPTDPRNLRAGWVVADRNGYYDSQNVVCLPETDPVIGDREVLSVVYHHSENREGGPGLRLWSTRSLDGGRSWSRPVAVDSPERQSHDGYQLVQVLPSGLRRILVFYGWNAGSQPPAAADGIVATLSRTDMQLDEGYWLRISDDGGRTWGTRRWSVPVRRTAIDRANPWSGTTMGMFMCDKPSVIDGAVMMAFQKSRDGAGETAGSEVFFLRSPDLLAVDDPDDATWETLPSGDVGLRAPGGELDLGEEPHVLAVGDLPGRLFTLWRTEVGRLAASYSDDGGVTWDTPFWLTYEGAPTGEGGRQEIKNPRGSITPFRRLGPAPDGAVEYVMLFYNNGHTERLGYTGRRVYWLTVGRSTADGLIRWTQPEIALYWDGVSLDERPGWNPEWAIVDGPGYPDWIETHDGRLLCVESNKLAVRMHEIDPRIVAFAREQPELCEPVVDGLVVDWSPGTVLDATPVLPDLRSGGGFSITVMVTGVLGRLRPGGVVVEGWSDVTAALGEEPTDRRITKGWGIGLTRELDLEIVVRDGFDAPFAHATSRGDQLWDGRPHVVTFTFDGGPKVVMVVVDDRLDDGGAGARGWAFHPPHFGEIGGAEVTIAPSFGGTLLRLLVHDRPMLVSEAIGAARAMRVGQEV